MSIACIYYISITLYFSWSLPVSVPASRISLRPLPTTTVQGSFDNGYRELSLLSGRYYSVSKSFRNVYSRSKPQSKHRRKLPKRKSNILAFTISSQITLIHMLIPRPLIWHTLVRKKDIYIYCITWHYSTVVLRSYYVTRIMLCSVQVVSASLGTGKPHHNRVCPGTSAQGTGIHSVWPGISAQGIGIRF